MKTNKIPKKGMAPKAKQSSTAPWMILGIASVLIGGAGYWYYRKKKKETEMPDVGTLGMPSGSMPISTRPTTQTSSSSPRTRFRCTSKDYPLQYGTCNSDVKILQAYLKRTYKAALGASGPGRDGVDGMFGNKTNTAAKKYLGKASFTKEDINGMRTANKLLTSKKIRR